MSMFFSHIASFRFFGDAWLLIDRSIDFDVGAEVTSKTIITLFFFETWKVPQAVYTTLYEIQFHHAYKVANVTGYLHQETY